MSVRFTNDAHNAEIACRSVEAAVNRNMPKFTFMGMCNHLLYDNQCTVDPSLFEHVGNVDSISGETITVAGAGLQPDGFFTGGYVQALGGANDFRMVRLHVGDVLTLLLPFQANVLNTSVQAFAGCDHVLTQDCALKFDNVINFGGFHFVPNRNVFETGL